MAALSKDPNYKNVTIDGKPVVIDKSSVKEECYEIIMSMLYKTQFGQVMKFKKSLMIKHSS